MGALHDGHLALIRQSLAGSDITVCSIFVNPTQFNDPSDFKHYPNRINEDIRMLEQSGAHLLYIPAVADIYPQGTADLEYYDLGYLESVLEGKYRPGHFQGVCQVMSRLLKAVKPDLLYMGQKDYQQCMVVRKLLEHLKLDVEFVACPTLREKDGLAMSSRNMRLSATERQIAPKIFQTLMDVKENIAAGDLAVIKQKAVASLEQAGFKVDYFEIADAHTLEQISNWNGSDPVVALVAAFLGEVRLIDNMLLNR